ncbi:MAG: hypothetical protein ACJ8B6_03095 [Gemmatimonadales bacterium]
MLPRLNRALLLLSLACSLAVACGGDDGPDDGDDGDGGGGTGTVPLGTSQLSASQRSAVVARLNAIAAEVGDLEPFGGAALQTLAGAVQAEGWVTGVDANTALAIMPENASGRAALQAMGRWGVFGVSITAFTGIDPQTQLPAGSFIRGVVAIRDTTIVLGYVIADVAEGEPHGSTFPTLSTGLVFDGPSHQWIASAGLLQLSTADSVLARCSGYPADGIDCYNASFSNGTLAISTSEPVPGTGAQGNFTTGFSNLRLRGYQLDVDCSVSSRC